MANIKISALPSVQPSGYTNDDLLVIVNYDVSSGTTKNTPLTGLTSYVLSGLTFPTDYLPLSGGTVTGDTIFNQGLTANTISASTYLGLPLDVYVTGGTYSAGTITFTNNSGGTFPVSGITSNAGNQWLIPTGDTVTVNSNYQYFIYGNLIVEGTLILETDSQLVVINGDVINSGGTITNNGTIYNIDIPLFDTQVTGGTYSAGTITFTNNSGGTFTVTGLTTSFTGNTSGDCITDLFVKNLNSCSPLHIQNVSSGNVLIGENGGVNVGIGTTNPTEKLFVSGNTYISGTSSEAYFGVNQPYIQISTSDFLKLNDSNLSNSILAGNNSVSLKIGGSSNGLYVNNTNNLVGNLLSYNFADYLFKSYYSGSTNYFEINHIGFNGDNKFGVNTIPTATIHTKGSDSSSGFGLKVQNSGGTNTLQVRNDGLVDGYGNNITGKNNFKLGDSNNVIGGTGLTVGRDDSNSVLSIYGANYPTLRFNANAYSSNIDLQSASGGQHLTLTNNSQSNFTWLSPTNIGINFPATAYTIDSTLKVMGSDSSTGFGLKVQNSGGTDNFVVRNDGKSSFYSNGFSPSVNGFEVWGNGNLGFAIESSYGKIKMGSTFNTATLNISDYGLGNFISFDGSVAGARGLIATNTGLDIFGRNDLAGSYETQYVLSSDGHGVWTNTTAAFKRNVYIGGIGEDINARLLIKGETADSFKYGLKVQDSGGTDNFVVRNDGNVGIGTSTPTEKLEVVGNLKVNTNNLIVGNPYSSIGDNINNGVRLTIKGYGSGSSGNEILRLNDENNNRVAVFKNDGTVGIGTSFPTRVLDSRGTFNLQPNTNTFLRFDGTLMEAQVGNSNNQLTLNRDNSGITDLKGSGSVIISNSTYSNSLSIGGNTILRENDKIVFSRSDNFVQGWWDTNNNRFRVGGGSYSPIYTSTTETFEVVGTSKITSNVGIGITGSTDVDTRLKIVGSDSSSSNYGLKVQDSSGVDNFVVRNDGNVGIGTASPSETLDVTGKTKTANFQMTSGATSTGYVLTDSDGFGNAQWQPASGITGVGNVFKYTTTSAFTASVTQTITHNLNTKFVHCSVWDSSDQLVTAQVVRTSGNQTNAVDITISTSGTYDILITG